MHKVSNIKGVVSKMTGESGVPEDNERSLALQHAKAGADFLTLNSDGTYDLEFPSLEGYRDFLEAVANSTVPDEEKVATLARHANAS
jgi:hypothetical protein